MPSFSKSGMLMGLLLLPAMQTARSTLRDLTQRHRFRSSQTQALTSIRMATLTWWWQARLPFDGQGQVSVYLNTGNGILAPRVDYLTGNNTKDIAIGDLNNDGVPDLVAANEGDNTVSVLLGTGAACSRIKPSIQ